MGTGLGLVFKDAAVWMEINRRDSERNEKALSGERALKGLSKVPVTHRSMRNLDTLAVHFGGLRNGHFKDAVLTGGLNGLRIRVVRQ